MPPGNVWLGEPSCLFFGGLLFPASPAARVTITTSIEGPRTVDPWKGEQRNNREAGPILACVGAPRAVQEHCAGSRSYHGRKVSGNRQSSVVCRSSASGPIISSAIWGSSHSQTGFALHKFVYSHVVLLSRAVSRFVPPGLVPYACFKVSSYFQGCSLLNLGTLRTLCHHTVQCR